MKTICHITVLNPVRHVRVYHRLAKSQKAMGYEVHVVGQGAAGESTDERGIHLHGTGVFGRLSARRLSFTSWVKPLVLDINADQYWLHSPELLRLGRKVRRETGASVIYDVHEDYPANVRAGNHYPIGTKKLLATYIRQQENRAAKWLSAISYAELAYQGMIQIAPEKTFFLRNTFVPHLIPQEIPAERIPRAPYLVMTGTLAPAWGIWEGIQLWEQMCTYRPIPLIIAGYHQQTQVIHHLRTRLQASPFQEFATLIGGDVYVPYEEIITLIRHCYAGIGLYETLPHLVDKVPTKFYEFMAMNRPLLTRVSPGWRDFDQKYHLGVNLSPNSWEGVLNSHKGRKLYDQIDDWYAVHQRHDPTTYSWASDEQVLAKLMQMTC